MKIEKKLDKIIDILYDDNLLQWKEIPTTDIVIFGKKKFNITWTDAEVNFIMSILISDGYVVMNPGDFSGNNMKMPTYSLTTKGVQLKRKGGFARTKLIEDLKQHIILWGSIIALIVSFMTIYDFVEKHCMTKEEDKCCNCCCKNDEKESCENDSLGKQYITNLLPDTLYKGDTLKITFNTPHPKDFAITDPDTTFFYVVNNVGDKSHPSLVDWDKFENLNCLEIITDKTTANSFNVKDKENKIIFTKTGNYEIALSEVLCTDDGTPVERRTVHYIDRPRKK